MTVTEVLPTFPDEVVTHAHVQYVELPLGAGTTALVTLDNGHDHTKPTTFGPQGLRNIEAALDEALARDGLVALAVTGKPFVFAVGADLKVLALGGSREDALAIGRAGHRVFRRLKDADVPTFAFVNGAVIGGGLELALHCTYRTLSSSVPAVALPECFLGLVPGWGGSQLVPNLVGPEAAVRLILENPLDNNRMLKAAHAFDMGLADALLDAPDFLEQSLTWAAQVVRGDVAVRRRTIDRGAAWDAALARGRAVADARTRGKAPAPYRALELLALARTADFDTGTAAEDEALGDLAFSDELRAGLYAFDLVQRRAKRPAGAPEPSLARPVTKVGVVGAGLMATQLALLFARRLEVPVVMTDLDQARVDRGVAGVHGEVDKLVGKGRLSADRGNRLRGLVTGSTDVGAFADAGWVIEAVFEDLAVKRTVFAQLEDVVSPECVLATNTSSLSVSEMARDLCHPERVVGFHFFNPVAVLPLLEVVRAERTGDATLATAFQVGRALKKSCVLVKDAPAFVFNRIVSRALGEVLAAVDAGTPIPVADGAVAELGMPMPPFALLQLVGPAIALHTAETLHEAFPDRFSVSAGLRALVAAGKRGVYTVDAKGRPALEPDAVALWPQGDAPLSADEVLDRARCAVAEEVAVLLDEGVVAAAQDVDLCLILGGGWAFWNGGITPYLDRTGVSERVNGRRFLPPRFADAPRS